MTNNKRNKQYTNEFKNSILNRLEQNETVGSLSEELNISKSTIYQWVRTNNKKQNSNSINLKSKKNWTSEDKFHVVIETAPFTENELAEYCRKKGIYLEEINAWKDQCLNANTTIKIDPKELKENLKIEQQKTKSSKENLPEKKKH